MQRVSVTAFTVVGVLAGLMSAACGGPDPTTATPVEAQITEKADAELHDYRLGLLEDTVRSMPESTERDYFGGVLAVRSGRFDEGVRLLGRALPRMRESSPARAAIALEAMATAHLANYLYREAALAYAELTNNFAGQLTDGDRAEEAAISRILSGSPPQTVTWQGPVRLKTTRNPLGLPVTELTVNGVRESWLLDTGANQSVVTQSFARRLGLLPLSGVAPVGSGLTGLQSSVRVALVPTLPLGGATLKDVVVMIFDDANLRVGSGADAYQIDAIIGYPAFKALGAVTFTPDEFRAGEAAEKSRPGARMYMRGLTPAIECDVEGQPLLFTLDTGATSTGFSVRYYDRFREAAGSWNKHSVETGGAGGSIHQDVYIQPQVVLKAGPTAVTLKDVSISPARMNAGIDVLFGNLGQDFVEGFESFTLDFAAMTFGFGAPLRR